MYPGQFFCIFMLLHLSFGSADQCGVNIISTDVADETPQSFIFSGPTIIADVKVMNPYIYQLTGLKCCANIYQKPNYKGQRQFLNGTNGGLGGFIQTTSIRSYQIDDCQILERQNAIFDAQSDGNQHKYLRICLIMALVLSICIGLIWAMINLFCQTRKRKYLKRNMDTEIATSKFHFLQYSKDEDPTFNTLLEEANEDPSFNTLLEETNKLTLQLYPFPFYEIYHLPSLNERNIQQITKACENLSAKFLKDCRICFQLSQASIHFNCNCSKTSVLCNNCCKHILEQQKNHKSLKCPFCKKKIQKAKKDELEKIVKC